MVIWSSPAWPRRSSSLPNASRENGQVGFQESPEDARPVAPDEWISPPHILHTIFLLRLVHKRRRPEGDQTLRAGNPAAPNLATTTSVSISHWCGTKGFARSFVPSISQ
jgi:hypothetical protein